MNDGSLIEIRKIKDVKVEGGVVFDGFQSFGLTSTIACACFINSLKTDLVGILDSPFFPPLSVVYDSSPNFPARIYSNEEKKLTFFVSELNLDTAAYRPIAEAMLNWTTENKCKMIISITGRPMDKKEGEEEVPVIHAISNSIELMKNLHNVGIPPLKNGTIRGIPGILLNEAVWRNVNVVVFVVDVISGDPDFRAAAIVSQAISKIVPGAYCDIKQLIREAEDVENHLKLIKNQTSSKLEERIYT